MTGRIFYAGGTAIPAADLALTSATQAEMEAASSTTVYATPGRTQFHPGVAKAWADYTIAAVINASYNVGSITDTGAGDARVNLTTVFSSANWAMPFILDTDSAHIAVGGSGGQTAGVGHTVSRDTTGTATDPTRGYYMAGFGDQ